MKVWIGISLCKIFADALLKDVSTLQTVTATKTFTGAIDVSGTLSPTALSVDKFNDVDISQLYTDAVT